MSRWGLLFMFLIFCVTFHYAQPDHVEQEHPFDVLIFTQNWPVTVCKGMEEKSHTCHLPKDQDTWTIHGVWPTKMHTIGPLYCNRSWHFDPEAVKPIEVNLTELWPSIEDGSVYPFWSHEWVKHGTCAAQLEPFNSEYKYFLHGLNWQEKYSMSNILTAANIIPSNDKGYPISIINKAITDALHINPRIECKKIDGKDWLMEIRICFNKSLSLTNCDGTLFDNTNTNYITNCNINQPILYPKDLKRSFDDYFSKLLFNAKGVRHHHKNRPEFKINEVVPQSSTVQLYNLVDWVRWFTF